MEDVSKILKRFKSWSLSKCIEKTAQDLQRLVRMEAADDQGYARCCSCGARKHWKELQGGHFISRSHKATILDEDNVHPQCPRCNINSGNIPGYFLHIVNRYGADAPSDLAARGREVKQWTREELADLRYSFRVRIKEQEARLDGK